MPYSVESVSLKVIQKNFVYKNYPVELLKKIIEIAEKDATFFESIPGEIIGWTSTDKGIQTRTETFKIKNGTLTKINTTVSESDLKRIDKFAPKWAYLGHRPEKALGKRRPANRGWGFGNSFGVGRE